MTTLHSEKTIHIKDYVGSFAENKDIARDLCLNHIEPILKDNGSVILDFAGIDGVTQSFIHALISNLIRVYSSDVIDRLSFKNCNEEVKGIVSIVVDYMQQIDEL